MHRARATRPSSSPEPRENGLEARPALFDASRLVWRLSSPRDHVRVSSPSTLPVLGDEALLERAVEQLLASALKPTVLRVGPTPQGGVRIALTSTAGPTDFVHAVARAHGGSAGAEADGQNCLAWIEVPTLPRTH